MSGPGVQVRGVRQLRASLKRLGDDLQDFKAIHARAAAIVTTEARGRVRPRSGRLAASGRPGATKTRAVTRFGGARVPYANAVHWGTGARPGLPGPHNIRPNRFATTAAAATEPAWTGLYLAEVDRLVARVKGD